MYAMYSSDRAVFQRCACALAHMASIPDLHAAFVERKGLDILVDMLTDGKRDTRDALQREAASAPLSDPASRVSGAAHRACSAPHHENKLSTSASYNVAVLLQHLVRGGAH